MSLHPRMKAAAASQSRLSAVIYELRTYQVQAGKVPEFLNVYREKGLPIFLKKKKMIKNDRLELNHCS
jgi:hypothetical protein